VLLSLSLVLLPQLPHLQLDMARADEDAYEDREHFQAKGR
jgi:hypothetical protein